MRPKIVVQHELDLQGPPLSRATKEYVEQYERISAILDQHSEILDTLDPDLQPVLEKDSREGRQAGRECAYTSETVLRVLICQVIENLSLRKTVVRIDDSRYLRRFVRIYEGPMMDYSTLDKLKNAIKPQTWKRVNQRLAQAAVSKGWVTGESLRLDTTLVETNIHWPTDSSLLWDVYRVLGSCIEEARQVDKEAAGKQRLHLRRAKRLYSSISRTASNRSEKAKQKLKTQYRRLIGLVEGILSWSAVVQENLAQGLNRGRYRGMEEDVKTIIARIAELEPLGQQVLSQAIRRVLQGEQVPNEEKLFSIFEPHTELVKRGKQGKAVEFGHMIELNQVGGKFITAYEVFDTRPVDHQLVEPALRSHRELFGHYPDQLTADKGFYENMETIRSLGTKVKTVAIGKKGNRTDEELAREHAALFRIAQRFRAGIEGTISFLKRAFGLFRCLNKGWQHYCATVGAAIFAHNLLNLART